ITALEFDIEKRRIANMALLILRVDSGEECHTPKRGLDGIRVRGRDVIIIRTQGTRERPLMDVLEIITRCIV
ncbi:hypothetical protein Tco_0395569, partial [Tanacetum coccineum]